MRDRPLSWLSLLFGGRRHREHLHDLLHSIKHKVDLIMATSAEHAQRLRDLLAQNEKARAENVRLLEALRAEIAAAGGTTPEVDEALNNLAASIQAEDDENADEESPPV